MPVVPLKRVADAGKVQPTARGTVQVPFNVGGVCIVVEFTIRQWMRLAVDVQTAFAGIAAEHEMWETVRDIERWESVT